jgi:hypothetical protein
LNIEEGSEHKNLEFKEIFFEKAKIKKTFFSQNITSSGLFGTTLFE